MLNPTFETPIFSRVGTPYDLIDYLGVPDWAITSVALAFAAIDGPVETVDSLLSRQVQR